MSVRNMHNVIAVAGTIWTDQRATLPRHNSWFVIVYRAEAPLRCPDVCCPAFSEAASMTCLLCVLLWLVRSARALPAEDVSPSQQSQTPPLRSAVASDADDEKEEDREEETSGTLWVHARLPQSVYGNNPAATGKRKSTNNAVWNVVKHLKEHTVQRGHVRPRQRVLAQSWTWMWEKMVYERYRGNQQFCTCVLWPRPSGVGVGLAHCYVSSHWVDLWHTKTSEAAYSGICEIRIEGVRLAAGGNRGGHAVQLAGSEKAEGYTETGQRCCPCRRPGSSCDGAGHSRLCCRLWVGG